MKTPLYAALDLHSRYSVLGSMDYDGNTQPKVRFPTSALLLRKNIEALRQKKRPIYLTMEAGAFTRWASAIARPLVEQLPAEEERRMMRRLYGQFDHALLQWKETLKEVERLGAQFWEVHEFERVPGVGPIAAHVFSAIIEEAGRFHTKHQLWKYSQLGITDRTSDGKPLGYQRLDRRGHHELKNLSYHAWRTACTSTTVPNPIKSFYQQSRLRTGSVRHARLNTQRKILETMWMMWLRQKPFDPARFAPIEKDSWCKSGTENNPSD